jgi:hypothetical protein
MAIDPRPKGATPSADKDWIERALSATPAAAARASADTVAAPDRAANDDRRSVGEMLRALQFRPAAGPYLIAAAFAAFWAFGGLIFSAIYFSDLLGLAAQSAGIFPVLLGLAALLLLPPSFFFILAHMAQRARELRRMSQSMAELVVRFAEPESVSHDSISKIGEAMRREVTTMTEGVDRALARAAELETRVHGQVSALERAHKDAETRMAAVMDQLARQSTHIAGQTDQVRGAVAAGRDYSEKSVELMQSYLGGLDTRADAKAAEIAAGLERSLARFQEAVETRSRGVDETLDARTQDMIRLVNECGRDLAAAFDRRVKDATIVLDSRGGAISDILGAKIEEMDKALESRISTLTRNLDAQIADFEDFAAGRAQGAAVQIEAQSKIAADALDAHLGQLTQTIKTNAAEATGLIEARSRSAIEMLNAHMRQLAEAIDGKTGNVRQSLGKLAEDIEGRMTSACAGLSAALSEDVDAAAGKLNTVSTSVTGALSQNAEHVERTLLSAGAEAASHFVGKADHVATTLRRHAAEMTQLLDEKSSGLLAAVTRRSQEFTTEVTSATERAVKALEGQGRSFAQAVTENGVRIAADISAASQSATEAVGQSLKQIEETTQAAIARSRLTTTASLSELREVHAMLHTDSMSLFERLREANVVLREALGAAQENIGALDKKLGKKMKDFASTVAAVTTGSGAAAEQLTNHINSFQQSTVKVLEDLSQLALQFESHGHSLMQAVDLIDNINRRAVDAVNDRGTVLDSLITVLDAKAGNFEERLLRFSTLLEDSLENATSRTRDIGLLIAEASSQGVRAITEQYDLVRSAVETEQQHTTDTLRNVYQSTVGDAQNMLQQSTERFTELLHGLKHMVAEMQREIEVTRVELRRGMVDIPQETAERTAQMRQLIVDQIEALSELQRVVARHGQGMSSSDARPPARQEPAFAAPPANYSERARPARGDAAPPPLPMLSRRDGAPAGQRSWLSDLLHRASRGGEGGESGSFKDDLPARHIESLDALSVDIARMIDHDAASDLWDRYNRGERNVFNRKLYTPQGLKAFDEIRTRYRNERDFKATADRYMKEFERLLEEVSRDDRGQAVVRTYLMSETGKVYTLLAHAAGRFD